MPPETDNTDRKEKRTAKDAAALCVFRGPGPKYKLKTLVGYNEHCISKLRNPAYTFGNPYPGPVICEGPGPKYLVTQPKGPAFTFGYPAIRYDGTCGPGPKYSLPSSLNGPIYSMKWRTNYRACDQTPGPYPVKSTLGGPAFTMGLAAGSGICEGPGPRDIGRVDLIKPRAPMYTIALKQDCGVMCETPGPKYHPEICKRGPMYSFGLKHSVCTQRCITECDDDC